MRIEEFVQAVNSALSKGQSGFSIRRANPAVLQTMDVFENDTEAYWNRVSNIHKNKSLIAVIAVYMRDSHVGSFVIYSGDKKLTIERATLVQTNMCPAFDFLLTIHGFASFVKSKLSKYTHIVIKDVPKDNWGAWRLLGYKCKDASPCSVAACKCPDSHKDYIK